jgi:hypothetical protein
VALEHVQLIEKLSGLDWNRGEKRGRDGFKEYYGRKTENI